MSPPSDDELTELSFGGRAPRQARNVELSVRIQPRSGMVEIYAAPDDDQPIARCKGPRQQITVGFGSGRIFVRKVQGATEFEIIVVGWE